MKRNFVVSLIVMATGSMTDTAFAQDFGQGERRDLLRRSEPIELPQGKVVIGGGERLTPPGGRSPWHTAGGPKFLYVLEGTMTVEALG